MIHRLILFSSLCALVVGSETVPDRDSSVVGDIPQSWQPDHPPSSPTLCGGDVPDDNKREFLQCVGREGVHRNGEDGERPRGQAAGDLGADGEATTPAEDRALVEMLLHPTQAPEAGGMIEVAEMLMYVDVFPMCRCLRRHLDVRSGDVCDPKLREAVAIWGPWCRMLNECQEVAYSLLTAAYVCKAEGMDEYVGKYNPNSARGETERNTSSVLCRDAGANSCAIAMENLFVTTHANFTEIEQREDEITDALGNAFTDDLMGSIDAVQAQQHARDAAQAVLASLGSGQAALHPPPPSPYPPGILGDSRVGAHDFARLSRCMHDADVNARSLDLPMGLRQISGNGSYTSYADLFFDKCGVEYKWAWVWDDLYYYSGFTYAQQKWNEGGAGRAVAIAILVLDVLVLLCLLAWLVRCVRKGGCFWLCMKASDQEQTSLTSGGGGGDSSSSASSGTRTAGARGDGAKETEMGSVPDRSAVDDEPDDPSMRA